MCFLRLGDRISYRQGAMHRLTNVVHSGWMTKSPPEKKLYKKLFRAKWKQRFFVLHKPSGSLPDHYELSYYNSEQCNRKKGSIDLDQCEQIIESLDSDLYPYLLAIKTVCRNKVRTYFLATTTEDDMGSWVQCLCRVCGLKQEDTPTDIPDTRLSNELNPYTASTVPSSNSTTPNRNSGTMGTTATIIPPTVTTQPTQVITSRMHVPASVIHPNASQLLSTSPQAYISLNECTSGTPKRNEPYNRADSNDSVPEYQAPPPPDKRGPKLRDINEKKHGFGTELYDRPKTEQELYDQPRYECGDPSKRPHSGDQQAPSSSNEESDEDTYKIPPPHMGGFSHIIQTPTFSNNTTNLNIAVPLPLPRSSPASTRSSHSARPGSDTSLDGPGSEMYDVPPPRHTPPASPKPGHSTPPLSPPQRPPRQHHPMAQSPYQNIPPTTKSPNTNNLSAVPSAPTSSNMSPMRYDIPRTTAVLTKPNELFPKGILPPPPQSCGTGSQHSYINATTGQHRSPPLAPDMYLSAVTSESRNGQPSDLTFANIDLPPIQHKFTNLGKETSYTDLNKNTGSLDRNQAPPPLAPRPQRTTISHGMPVQSATGASSVVGSGTELTEVCPIWSSTRTKSFKRNNEIKQSPKLGSRHPPALETRHPRLPARNEVASSSEDDDNLSTDGNNTHHDLSIVRMSTVPAPPEPDEPELKYLDLDLETHGDQSRSPPIPHTTSATTEYREIDFIKTQALQDVKTLRQNKNK